MIRTGDSPHAAGSGTGHLYHSNCAAPPVLTDVTTTLEDNVLTVTIQDDGRGGADPQAGSGLRGMQDRLAALDGTLEIVSPRGAGTIVKGVIPCAS